MIRINTLRTRQNRPPFCSWYVHMHFLERNWTNISLKFVPKVQINNTSVLVQIMAWHQPGDKPSSEPMMVSLLMYICITWPQWVKNTRCYKLIWRIHTQQEWKMNQYERLVPVLMGGLHKAGGSALSHEWIWSVSFSVTEPIYGIYFSHGW